MDPVTVILFNPNFLLFPAKPKRLYDKAGFIEFIFIINKSHKKTKTNVLVRLSVRFDFLSVALTFKQV